MTINELRARLQGKFPNWNDDLEFYFEDNFTERPVAMINLRQDKEGHVFVVLSESEEYE